MSVLCLRDVDQVARWVAAIPGLGGELPDRFREQEVGGSELLALTREDLVQLGVSKVGHLRRVLSRIEQLGAGCDDEAAR